MSAAKILGAPPHEELHRARAALRAKNCDFALLASWANVTYVSGFEVPLPVGALPEMSYGPPLALCASKDEVGAGMWLVVPDALESAAHNAPGDKIGFETFNGFSPTDSHASFLEATRRALREAGLENAAARIGVETRFLPHAVSDLLAREFPRLQVVDADGAMAQARLLKTEREIALLRRACQVGDAGHRALAEAVREAGASEFEMWARVTASVNQAAGRDVPLWGELVTGPRSSGVAYPNGPHPRIAQAGDAALMDISGRVEGYWFDCSNTHIVGRAEPTPEQKRFAHASQDACEAAMNALRPQNLASDAARAAQMAFEKHGLPVAHYSGHQIGVAVNELPRLVPYDDTPIQAGMVFCVEPGAYQGPAGNFGARSEKMVLVTPSGPEILSTFEWGIAR